MGRTTDMDAKLVKKLKETFTKGTRIELIHMDDTQAPPDGTRGTVIGVDDIGSIMVRWDNGSSLSLVYGVDKFWTLCTVTTICYGETRVWDSRQEAMQYFAQGMANCEGSEQSRYASIFSQLADGCRTATDEA